MAWAPHTHFTFHENSNTPVHPHMYLSSVTLVRNIPLMQWQNIDGGWNWLMLHCCYAVTEEPVEKFPEIFGKLGTLYNRTYNPQKNEEDLPNGFFQIPEKFFVSRT